MGTPAFRNYSSSIQAEVDMLIDIARVQDGINVDESQRRLGEYDIQLANRRSKIEDFKDFFVDIKERWSKSKDRVIGFVCWARSLGIRVAPARYMRDLCGIIC